ncbi:DUF2149 domain-containing protein [Clostridium ljungdahlii]|nr:DUF2149 domain-containing protein [Clostridium ljungdahlii]
MRRRLIKSRRKNNRQAINPMESVVNLIDIMLIFACGLMVSIASLWNIKMNPSDQINKTKSNSYQDMGQVYEDPVTKKMYIIKTDESKSKDTSKTGAK